MPRRLCLGLPGRPCRRLTVRPDSRCDECARARERARGNRHERGYGNQHERTRERWRPTVEQGEAHCARCKAPIQPGQEWALDHTDDRTGYLGPSHKHCNASAGGKASHR